MQTLALDVRSALRGVARSPVFAAAALLSIAVGVGLNTTVFSWLDAMVFRPYPAITDPDRLVALNTAAPDGDDWPISYPVYLEWREASTSFAGIAAWTPARVGLRFASEDVADPAWSMLVSGNYFDVLGVRPVLGRVFTMEEEREAASVAVLAHAYWRRRFNGDVGVIGQTVVINGHPITVVGIAPAGFVGTYVGVAMDLWFPLTLQPRLVGTASLEDPGARWLQSVARLEDGVTLESARLELDALALRLSRARGDRPVTGALVRRTREQFLGSLVYPVFSAMLAITMLVLLVACANVAGLLLVRATARRREHAIRIAIGGGRGALLRPFLAESLILAAAGGALGVALAAVLRNTFMLFIPPVAYTLHLPLELNGRVLAFALTLTCGATLLFGLLPALRATRIQPAPVLRDGSRAGSAAASRLRAVLVAAQIAFSVTCLVCAGLFARSLQAMLAVDAGYAAPERVLLVAFELTSAGLDEQAGVEATRELVRRVRSIPGVRNASTASMVPLGFGGHRFTDARIEGYIERSDDNVAVERVLVGSNYFETMGVQVLAGRGIGEQDRRGARAVAVVNQAFVRRFVADGAALGRQLDLGRGQLTIVGVASDVKMASVTETPYPVVYVPAQQWYTPAFTLHVRAAGDPAELLEPIRSAVAAVHRDLMPLDPRSLTEHFTTATFVQRTGAAMLGLFGGLALTLAVIGLYSALAYDVGLRSREIGIRRALGARATAVTWLVARRSLRLVGTGLVAGLVLSTIAAAALRRQLVSVGPTDPITMAGVVIVLLGAAAVASWAPARRALRTDPGTVLREE